MKPHYLDSSVILRVVLNQPGALKAAKLAPALISELAEVECGRVLDRLHLLGVTDEDELNRRRDSLHELLREVERLPLDRRILARAAGPLQVPLGSLDAIHLATAVGCAELHGARLVLATHDRLLARAARLHGLEVVGVAP